LKSGGSFSKDFDRILGFLAFCAGILIVLIMVAITVGVVLRFTPLGSIVWIFEITDYCLLWITFLGTAWVLKQEGHVRMDMILNTLKPRNQALLNMMTSIAGAIACLILAFFSSKVTWQHFQTHYLFTRFLEVPSYPILVIIPIGSLLLVVQFVRRTYGYFKAFRAGEKIESVNEDDAVSKGPP